MGLFFMGLKEGGGGGGGGGCKDAHDYIHNAFVRYIEIVGGETLYKVL